MSLQIQVFSQSIPLAQVFRISRGAKTAADVVVVVVSDGHYFGWGESVPYARYGESIASVTEQLYAVMPSMSSVDDHSRLDTLLPSGSARNALDCALWDLRAQRQNTQVNSLLGLPLAKSCITAQTISVDSAEMMQQSAEKLAKAPLVKVKLDADDVVEKMQGIQQICTNSQFIIDANEGWSMSQLQEVLPALSKMNVVLIEQPLPDDDDEELIGFTSPIPLCADESCHSSDGIDALVGKYDVVNVKLDKTGGLTEALKLVKRAQSFDFKIMVGCMVGSSLAMAPAYLLSSVADYVDLDGPLLVACDRKHNFCIENGLMPSIPEQLWGMGFARTSTPKITELLR